MTRRYHLAHAVNDKGDVLALCAGSRPVNLRFSNWTLRPEAVTCPKCRKIIASKKGKPQ